MSQVENSVKSAAALAILSNIDDWPKAAILKLKSSNSSDKDELKRLNLQLKSYLDNVKALEALNKSLIDQVEKAKEFAKPKLMDKGSLDDQVNMARIGLEDASADCVAQQTRIEECESLIRHLTTRLKFFNNEAEVNRQKIASLENNLKEMNGQHGFLIRSAQMVEEDLAREQAKQFKIEHDLDDLRAKLKDDRLKNKKLEFEMQTILDQLEFCKAVFNEEIKDFTDKLGGLNFSGPDLTNFYKNELVTAVQQIRQDFNDLNDQQIADYKANKEAELAFLVHENEKTKAIELANQAKLSEKSEFEKESSKTLRADADGLGNELNQLNAQNRELTNKLASLELHLSELRSKNSELIDSKQQEIDNLNEMNRSLSRELEYWDRVTRAKLETEIQTYRSILNSQLALMNRSTLNYERSEALKILQEAFNKFDSNKSGKINSSEVKNVLQKLNLNLSKDVYDQIIKESDADLSRDIDFNEFSKIMLPVMTGKFNDEELKYAFKKFDLDNSGQITVGELKRVLNKLGENYTRKQIADMISKVDKNNDNRLDFNEFCQIMRTLPQPAKAESK